jgi:hypothetical protein
MVCTLGPLIAILFLSAISCKVTWFPTKEAGEDFPLSVLLDRSSGVSSFSAASVVHICFLLGGNLWLLLPWLLFFLEQYPWHLNLTEVDCNAMVC